MLLLPLLQCIFNVVTPHCLVQLTPIITTLLQRRIHEKVDANLKYSSAGVLY
jgi:hypothetical protein